MTHRALPSLSLMAFMLGAPLACGGDVRMGTGVADDGSNPSAAALDFAPQLVDEKSDALALTIKNPRQRRADTLLAVTVPPPFFVTDFTGPVRLAGGASLTVHVIFAPPSAGTFNEVLRADFQRSADRTYALTGLALDPPSDTPSEPQVTLQVGGAPDLPFSGTTTPVTVGFDVGTPTRVELSRDGYPAFAVWPVDAFFTLAPDGGALRGSWCISRGCWGNVDGPHVLDVVAFFKLGNRKELRAHLLAEGERLQEEIQRIAEEFKPKLQAAELRAPS